MAAWEQILQQNESALNRNRLSIYKTNLKQYALLMSRYMTIRSALMYLSLKPNQELIQMLEGYGYKIDTSSSDAYAESVLTGLQRSENLISQLMTTENEINAAGGDDKINFELMLAQLSMAIGFSVPETIKLKEYNAYYQTLNQIRRERN